MQSLLILGRQPALGLAELESLYGSEKVHPLSKKAVLVDVDPSQLDFKRLGGSLKSGSLLATVDSTDWRDIEGCLINKTIPELVKTMPDGKMTLGLSLYGFSLPLRSISASALKIKRAIQKTGRSIRLVPNKNEELNTAQVIYNKLTTGKGLELLIIKTSAKTYIAKTVMVQDIEAYASRDQARPYRDSRVGMLPPKLAQIIINLAAGRLQDAELRLICLDPFCGSGVILQEASLMGYELIGSDLDPRMVEYSKKNLDWLNGRYKTVAKPKELTMADARNKRWPKFNFVATETSLGKPITSLPPASELNQMIDQSNALIEQFLKNVAAQTPSGLRLCLGIPAWQIRNDEFKSLPLIDHLSDLGYNLVDFKHTGSKDLIYYRPLQLVARELLTITRI